MARVEITLLSVRARCLLMPGAATGNENQKITSAGAIDLRAADDYWVRYGFYYDDE